MARENVKFRSWDEKHSRMIYDDILVYHEDGRLFSGITDPNEDWTEPVLLQFTGLVDKNGKEIFEDDIVETSYSRDHEQRHAFQVEWYEDGGQWVFTPFEVGNADAPLLGIEEFSHSWDDGFSDGNAEIIGNIYENPELLTK